MKTDFKSFVRLQYCVMDPEFYNDFPYVIKDGIAGAFGEANDISMIDFLSARVYLNNTENPDFDIPLIELYDEATANQCFFRGYMPDGEYMFFTDLVWNVDTYSVRFRLFRQQEFDIKFFAGSDFDIFKDLNREKDTMNSLADQLLYKATDGKVRGLSTGAKIFKSRNED